MGRLTSIVLCLLSFCVISSCRDLTDYNEGEIYLNKVHDTDSVIVSFSVSVSVPQVSYSTRASSVNANIDEDNSANGGKIQNIVILIVDPDNRLVAIDRNHWYAVSSSSSIVFSEGTDFYTHIFSDVSIPSEHIQNNVLYRAYAISNLPHEIYTNSWNLTAGKTLSSDINGLLSMCLSVDSPYEVDFNPGVGKYKINGTKIETCTGMPASCVVSQSIKSSSNVFNIELSRVCARVSFRVTNKTDGNVYIDRLLMRNCLPKNTYLFSTNTYTSELSDLDIDSLISTETAHHKISSGESLDLSMFVFESISEGYRYELNVDKGGLVPAMSLVPGNIYVLWDSDSKHSISYTSSEKIHIVPQSKGDEINYDDQVLWQFIPPKAGETTLENTFSLKHYPVNSNGKYDITKDGGKDVYFSQQKFNSKFINSPESDIDKSQYFYFINKSSNSNIYGALFLQNHNPKYGGYWGSDKGYQCFKIVNYGTCELINEYYTRSSNKPIGSVVTIYKWSLYCKNEVKTELPFMDGLTNIKRNESYEMTINIK